MSDTRADSTNPTQTNEEEKKPEKERVVHAFILDIDDTLSGPSYVIIRKGKDGKEMVILPDKNTKLEKDDETIIISADFFRMIAEQEKKYQEKRYIEVYFCTHRTTASYSCNAGNTGRGSLADNIRYAKNHSRAFQVYTQPGGAFASILPSNLGDKHQYAAHTCEIVKNFERIIKIINPNMKVMKVSTPHDSKPGRSCGDGYRAQLIPFEKSKMSGEHLPEDLVLDEPGKVEPEYQYDEDGYPKTKWDEHNKIFYHPLSKNKQIEQILEDIQKNHPGQEVVATFWDDSEDICEDAARKFSINIIQVSAANPAEKKTYEIRTWKDTQVTFLASFVSQIITGGQPTPKATTGGSSAPSDEKAGNVTPDNSVVANLPAAVAARTELFSAVVISSEPLQKKKVAVVEAGTARCGCGR